MDQSNSEHRAHIIASEIESMIAWADEQQDFVLSAWLAQVQAHIDERYRENP